MHDAFKQIIESTGDDISREGLLKTPDRAAETFLYLTGGYSIDIKSMIEGSIFPAENQDIVIVKDIEVYSLCEHHLLPFFGKCHVAYVPNSSIIGLSKISRIVDTYSRRLQVQEKLTYQIADTLFKSLNAQGVAVIIEAQHLCMMMRGVKTQSASMLTKSMLGCFKDDAIYRNDFINLIK